MTSCLHFARLALVLLAHAGAACRPPPDAAAVDAAPAWVELGTGAEGFVPLAAAGPLALYTGMQGGFHLFLSLRAGNLAPGDPTLTTVSCDSEDARDNPCIDLVVREGDAELDLFVPLRLALVGDGDGAYLLPRPRLVQLDVPDVAALAGRSVTVRATVTDRFGVSAEATVSATVVPAALE
ncbi:MAG: hypothetical protein EXR73_08615 [Myxococcales bacterium]|nr:hypothetical protein [Myxococcales bacterium]